MLSSLTILFKSPYNRKHPFFALKRFFYWKFIRLLKRSNVLYRVWGDRFLYLNYDSFQSMWVMYNYVVDWEEFHLIQRYLKAGDTAADVGANMGFYSIWMSKFTGCLPESIHSFEPDNNNYNRLCKNIDVNNLGAVIKANNLALGDRERIVYFSKGLDGMNHIVTSPGKDTVSVRLTTIDNYCNEQGIRKIAYCKVDVEGFEVDVLKGAWLMLQGKKIDILQLEINRTIENSGYTISDLMKVIEACGYTLCSYNVKRNLLCPLSYTDDRENYFAVADINLSNKKLRF